MSFIDKDILICGMNEFFQFHAICFAPNLRSIWIVSWTLYYLAKVGALEALLMDSPTDWKISRR